MTFLFLLGIRIVNRHTVPGARKLVPLSIAETASMAGAECRKRVAESRINACRRVRAASGSEAEAGDADARADGGVASMWRKRAAALSEREAAVRGVS
jgi:hypothetical protein